MACEVGYTPSRASFCLNNRDCVSSPNVKFKAFPRRRRKTSKSGCASTYANPSALISLIASKIIVDLPEPWHSIRNWETSGMGWMFDIDHLLWASNTVRFPFLIWCCQFAVAVPGDESDGPVGDFHVCLQGEQARNLAEKPFSSIGKLVI